MYRPEGWLQLDKRIKSLGAECTDNADVVIRDWTMMYSTMAYEEAECCGSWRCSLHKDNAGDYIPW